MIKAAWTYYSISNGSQSVNTGLDQSIYEVIDERGLFLTNRFYGDGGCAIKHAAGVYVIAPGGHGFINISYYRVERFNSDYQLKLTNRAANEIPIGTYRLYLGIWFNRLLTNGAMLSDNARF